MKQLILMAFLVAGLAACAAPTMHTENPAEPPADVEAAVEKTDAVDRVEPVSERKVLTKVQTKRYQLVALSTPAGIVYDVRLPDGETLSERIDIVELEALYPDLHRLVNNSVAHEQLDATNTLEPDNASIEKQILGDFSPTRR